MLFRSVKPLEIWVTGYYWTAQLCPACDLCDSENVTAVRVLFQVRSQRHKRHRDGESNCLTTRPRSHSPLVWGGGEGGASKPAEF